MDADIKEEFTSVREEFAAVRGEMRGSGCARPRERIRFAALRACGDGSTGVVLVVDGRTKDVTASIAGSRNLAEYRAAIDAALNRARQ